MSHRNSDSALSASGISVNWFTDRLSEYSWDSWPSDAGMAPVSLLNRNDKNSSWDRLPSDAGMASVS